MPEARIIIIGAGLTGLGAAWRLQELGYGNCAILGLEIRSGKLQLKELWRFMRV